MTHMPQFSRRSFVASVAALGGGLALGFHLPIGAGPAGAAAGSAEVNAWVVIQPDDAVVIRVARWEMGPRCRCWSPRSSNATETRSTPSFRRPTKICAGIAPGETCRPAAAGRFALHRNTSVRRALQPGRCWSPPRRSNGM